MTTCRRALGASLLIGALAGCGDATPARPEPTGQELADKLALYHMQSLATVAPIFDSKFLGVQILEHPVDMWVMQEMITEIRPDYIIEPGTYAGGSALYYAWLLEQVNPDGEVISIDIAPRVEQAMEKLADDPVLHARVTKILDERVEMIVSNSVDPALAERLARRVSGKTVMVMLDSCHNYEHVRKELELYAPMVSVGSYLVVGDTAADLGIEAGSDLMRRGVECPGYTSKAGPGKAAREFVAANPEFVVDASRERFLLTFFPSGYLKRVR